MSLSIRAWPAERLSFILDDARCALCVTRRYLAAGLTVRPGLDILALDEAPLLSFSDGNPPLEVHPENAAYVIYTSGSTGRPKGVVITQRSLTWYTLNARECFAIEPGDRVLQFASIGFDLSVAEIFPFLGHGAAVVLAEGSVSQAVSELCRRLSEGAVTLVFMATAFWHELVSGALADPGALAPTLRMLGIGTERVIPERIADWRRRVGRRIRLVNSYGPTETTVDATFLDLTRDSERDAVGGKDTVERIPGQSPIGRPVASVRIHVLDRGLRTVPVGTIGELCTTSPGMARGYLDRPHATAERFVPHSFSHRGGERLYRTGDLARYLPDGRLVVLGRLDEQVKVRGFWVEPGEIESVLGGYPAVRQAAVTIHRGSLVAHVAAAPAVSASELRGFLRTKLPEHMVPSRFVFVDELPRNAAGKLDRRALPAPGSLGKEGAGPAPRTETEEVIAGVWRDVLGLESVGVDEPYFDLGGHSLNLVEVHSRLQQLLGVEMPIVELFRYPTIRSLARHLSGEPESSPAPALRTAPQTAVGRTAAIAIIGMSGSFPGSPNLESFWQQLRRGAESISFFSEEELAGDGVAPELFRDPDYVPARGLLGRRRGHGGRRRRRGGRAQTPAGGPRRRGSRARGHPGLGGQQRRRRPDRLHGAGRRRPGGGDREGPGRRRRRPRHPRLRRGPRHRDPSGGSGGARRPDAGVSGLERKSTGLLRPRLGQDQHRSPRRCRRHRRTDQDRPGPEAP